MKAWLLVALLFVLPHLQACTPLRVLSRETPDPENVFQEVKAREQACKGLRGLARVKVSSAEKSFSVQEIFLARPPAHLRAESLGPLGTPQSYLVTDGQELKLYIPSENRYYRGEARPERLSFALPIALEPEEIVAFLLGRMPPMNPAKVSIRRDEGEGLWILDLVSPAPRREQSIWVDPHSFQILRGEIHRPGLSLGVVFRDFQMIQGILFPKEIQLLSSTPKVSIDLIYQEVELNPPWGPQDFILPVPSGATVLSWE